MLLVIQDGMRVLALGIGVTSLVFLALFGARYWGLSAASPEFQHPFFQDAAFPVHVVRVGDLTEATDLLGRHPQVLLWLDVHLSEDRQPLVATPNRVRERLTPDSLKPWRGPHVSRYSAAQLAPLLPEAVPLEQWLQKFPGRRLILNVADNVMDVDKAIIAAVTTAAATDRVLIHSDTDVILSSIKAAQPLWLYGTSWSELMRALTLDSVGLLPAFHLRADVWIAPLKIAGRDAFNRDVLDEVHRRHKRVLLGPLQSAQEVETARTFPVDGLIWASAGLFSANPHP